MKNLGFALCVASLVLTQILSQSLEKIHIFTINNDWLKYESVNVDNKIELKRDSLSLSGLPTASKTQVTNLLESSFKAFFDDSH